MRRNYRLRIELDGKLKLVSTAAMGAGAACFTVAALMARVREGPHNTRQLLLLGFGSALMSLGVILSIAAT
jgi:hypothetical protein